MKIEILIKEQTHDLFELELDQDVTLNDLIDEINKECIVRQLPEISCYGDINHHFTIFDLDCTLYHLFKGKGSKTLIASTQKSSETKRNLSDFIKLRTSEPFELKPEAIQHPFVQNIRNSKKPTEEYLCRILHGFPSAIVNLIDQYNDNKDRYLVVDPSQILAK